MGTIDSYFDANMELRSPLPSINLYNRRWRIRTAQRDYPPARFVVQPGTASSDIVDSLVCEGSIIQGAELVESVVGYDCFVRTGASVKQSILLSGCSIGAGAQLQRVLLDKNCRIDDQAVVGLDPVADRKRFPFVTESGIIVLPKGTRVPAEGPIELAYDIAGLLCSDPATMDRMAETRDLWVRGTRDRHSHESAGHSY